MSDNIHNNEAWQQNLQYSGISDNPNNFNQCISKGDITHTKYRHIDYINNKTHNITTLWIDQR